MPGVSDYGDGSGTEVYACSGIAATLDLFTIMYRLSTRSAGWQVRGSQALDVQRVASVSSVSRRLWCALRELAHRETKVPATPALLVVQHWAGPIVERVEVVGQTATRYRIRVLRNLRLPGRHSRVLEQ